MSDQGHFADSLLGAIDAAGSPICVGLDPVFERLPETVRRGGAGAQGVTRRAGAIEAFSLRVVDAVAGIAPAVKIQSACFERHGPEGVGAMRRVAAAARARGMVVILDAKRGDIGVTAEHYAAAAFDVDAGVGADAVTVNAYLGMDTLAPYLDAAWPGRGLFVLVRTSNPGADGVQSARLADGRSVAEMMADDVAALGDEHVGARGYSAVGAVVAATKPQDAAALRARMPRQVFLVPGYGAQGGGPDAVRALFNPAESGAKRRTGAIVTASRSVIYAFDPTSADWAGAVRAAAAAFAEEIAGVV